MTRCPRRLHWSIAAAVSASLMITVSGEARAAPLLVDPGAPDERITEIVVHSRSMDRDVPLTVIRPTDETKPRGVLYLLNGAGGGEDSANWLEKTDIEEFTKDKNLYVVIPNAGQYSYYTDWQTPDPVLGVNKWSTFLGKELPPVVDAAYNTSGRNAIGGISSSGTSVLNLAREHRELYEAVGAYSGCPTTSDPFGQENIRLVVEVRGRGDATNMWGPYNGPGWSQNDPVVNAHELRGKKLYISNASGVPGPYDNSRHVEDPETLVNQIVVGGAIEGATLACTAQLVHRLDQLNIPATVDIPSTGTHSWHYWQDQLHRSWSFYERALS
ncbi:MULTISPECIES: alpha/beta hydrolase [Gordonia]|uniref:Alpha/beta hydrolase family protein n=1 Tax=Gordonia amicalis TaxID=89053 RepID=A0AAE4R7H6_9ACTN|nr:MULTISPECIES: alpha/beta hydrolase family protein [Gordonia]KAF0969676.1 Diacylglycerol acyltransferase/mycolyltransferase Ag85A [Gordonia sp. YY1]MCZ0912100.1 alpha/beta hydrolase family protein [Gordonia amicalis]MCZ4578894.1 alpha/beta hydrolase family protein [Gordonia amicalis]MDH3010537.1 alpha/beta hydrolase family protein [Gordonia alkanivorans]MDV6311740.1 alpha/beta hydrolase family protein [Gordonia amicalis]